jgi:hypothetical protein
MVDLRLAIFATFLMLYFCGYPAIQYHERHFFHLNLVPLAALAFLATRTPRALQLITSRDRLRTIRGPARRAAVFVLALVVMAIGLLAPLRAYQSTHLQDALAARLAARREGVALGVKVVDDHRVSLETDRLPADATAASTPGVITSEYLIVRLGGALCNALRVPITWRYAAPSPRADFTRTMSIGVPENGETVQLMAPVFFRYRPVSDAADPTDRFSDYQFRGFEIESRDRDCLQGVERIADTTPFPLLLSATLAPDWKDGAFYQTLALVERPHAPRRISVSTAPNDLRVPRSTLTAPLRPLAVAARAVSLKQTGDGGWRQDAAAGIVNGLGPFGYLLTATPIATAAGDQLIVEGVMHEGGLTVGIVRGGSWLVQSPVTGAGRFLAVVQVPSDGEATVVIANNLPDRALANSFEIVKAGWIPAVSVK